MKIKRIAHLGIVVKDLDAALASLDFLVRAFRRRRPSEIADENDHTTPQMRPHPGHERMKALPLIGHSNIFSGRANNQGVAFLDL
jgi:hypothetical protein